MKNIYFNVYFYKILEIRDKKNIINVFREKQILKKGFEIRILLDKFIIIFEVRR